ncbi:MAG TPA: copper homeostasis protein CutC [Isosphaeraceae bacterium]|jgi:copper homeostasis protein|nr:copper homeostasis protein CutC [Isosphaeraceae bacterium]
MTPSRVLLETCIASVADARAASSGGADRLELNSALWLGGLTPSLGLLIEVKAAVALPVIAMARPRPGGFRYDEGDYRVLRRDVDLMLAHGADGIAFGILNDDGTIDLDRTRVVVRQVGDRAAVFHRAFDVVPDPFVALEQLIDLGVRRVLTSGQQESAYNGIPLLADLIRLAAGRIEVLPAGGINRFTVKDVIDRTGCDQVHASLRHSLPDPSTSARPRITFGGSLRQREDSFDTTDAGSVAELCRSL